MSWWIVLLLAFVWVFAVALYSAKRPTKEEYEQHEKEKKLKEFKKYFDKHKNPPHIEKEFPEFDPVKDEEGALEAEWDRTPEQEERLQFLKSERKRKEENNEDN